MSFQSTQSAAKMVYYNGCDKTKVNQQFVTEKALLSPSQYKFMFGYIGQIIYLRLIFKFNEHCLEDFD